MPVLGYNTIGASFTSTSRGHATKFTATEAGELIEIVCYSKSPGDINHKYGVFEDVGGANPFGAKLGETDPGSLGTSYAWRTLALLVPYTFANGESLWLREIADDNIDYPFDGGDTAQHAQTNPEYELFNFPNFKSPVDTPDGLYPSKSSIYGIYNSLSGATSDQEGFRIRNDDGSETGATWKAAQDTNTYAALAEQIRLRMLLDSAGDLSNTLIRLYYKKSTDGAYSAVPIGATVPEVYGSVTFGAIGTGANGSGTVAPSYPAGITAGQYLTLQVSSGGASDPTPSTPSGWTLLATNASTDGAYGLDTGPRRMTVFGKIADGTESGTLTVTITGGDSCRGTISRWTKAGSGTWTIEAIGANDSTSGTGVSMTFSSMNWNTGDTAMVAVSQRVDSATQSAQSLTASGVTFGTRTNRANTAVTTGNDHRHMVDTFAAISSTSDIDAAPTWAYTASAAASAGGVIVRLREYTAAITNPVYISASANITAGGESTTAQLTPPSGKTTSDFTTGRIWDDENGLDGIDIAADFYTEVEWSLKTQAPAADGDIYQFRIYANATPLTTYGITPEITIGAPPSDDTTSGFFTFF